MFSTGQRLKHVLNMSKKVKTAGNCRKGVGHVLNYECPKIMLSILSINVISVNEAQIQLSTLSTQYVAEFSIQVVLPAHNDTHVARALMNNSYNKNYFISFCDSALLCG